MPPVKYPEIVPGARALHRGLRATQWCTVLRVGPGEWIGGIWFQDARVVGDNGIEWWAPVQQLDTAAAQVAA